MKTLNTLFEISVYSGVILIAILLLKACFKNKMSPLLHYAVWFALVLRLMIPVTLASPVRLFVIPAEQQGRAALGQTQPQVNEPAGMSDIDTADTANMQPDAEAVNTAGNETPAFPVTAHMPSSLSLPQAITLVWLAGAGVCLLYLAALYASLRRRIRRNAAKPSKRLMELFKQARAEMGIEANIKLVCLYEYGTPSLMFPKTIMMPADALISMNDEQTIFALRHELTHYRRGDHIVSILLSLLNAVYWFNPFVWAAFRQMRKDMEAACDGAVVKTLCTAAKSRYALLIVNLSMQPAHRQLALGMSNLRLRRNTERRVKSIFMKGKSRMSVKIITVMLAVVLVLACFTTACQPTPETPIVAQKDALEQSIDTLPEQKDVFAPPDTWQDEYVRSATGDKVVVDADVVCPSFDSLDIMQIRPSNFTQQEVDGIIGYFAPGAALYNGEYQETKGDLEARIIETQRIMAMTQEERDASFGGYTDEQLQQELDDLRRRYAAAPEKAARTEVSSALKTDKDGFEVLEVYADNGGNDDVLFEVYNLVGESSASASLLVRLRDQSAGGKMLSYSGQPEEVAKAVLSDLGIEGAHNYRTGTVAGDKSSGKKNTRLFYEMTYKGLPVRAVCSLIEENERQYAGAVWRPDDISMDLSEVGVTSFYWSGHAEFGETVKENVALLPLDDIMSAFERNIFLQPIWRYGNEKDGKEKEASVYHITSIVLCMTAVPQRDAQGSYLLIPAWNFYGYRDYTAEGLENLTDEQLLQRGLDRPSADTVGCLMTLSAVDGSLLHR